jgi:Domain of unknown function (DUF4340)
MSWRAVGVVYAVLALLLGVVFVLDRQPTAEPLPPGAAAVRSLLGVEPAAVHAVVFRRGEAQVQAELVDGRWRTVEPAGAVVPSDLFDAAVATLTAGQASEVVAEGTGAGDLGAFGLVTPSSTIVLTTEVEGTTRDVTVFLGDRNPTHTALYARRAEDARVYLVGLNVRYYEDLIFTAAGAV